MSIGACQGIVLTNLIIPIILNPQEVEMNRNDTESSCVSTGGCCSVESVVSVDSRGQMVLPKDIREKANISAGDKLAVVGLQYARIIHAFFCHSLRINREILRVH